MFILMVFIAYFAAKLVAIQLYGPDLNRLQKIEEEMIENENGMICKRFMGQPI
jgi:hypothetical protein